MKNPNPPIADELLSAYLDDELNPDDAARVTAALKTDERLRDLVADLQQIRAEIRALPQLSLSTAFTDRVAESCVAESRVNLCREAVAVDPGTRSRRRPRWIAGVAAMAATILISFWAIGPGKNGNSSNPRSVAVNESSTLLEPDELAVSLSPAEADGSEKEALAMTLERQPESVTPLPAPSPNSQPSSADGIPESPTEVLQFGQSVQKDSVDAVVAVTIPANRLTELPVKVWRDDATRYSVSNGREQPEGKLSQINSYAFSSVQDLDDDLRRLGIESDAKVIVLDGTAEQISDDMRLLQATTTKTLLLASADAGNHLGLPPVESLAAIEMSEAIGVGDAESAPLPETDSRLSRQARATPKSEMPQVRAEIADVELSASTHQSPSVVTEAFSPAVQFRYQQTLPPRNYRILLIVNQ